MKKCLIVVDYQYDFVADEGLLTCGKMAQDIEQNLYALIQEYIKNKDDIIFTLDSHKKDDFDAKKHMESHLFPIHCEVGTKGNEVYGSVKKLYENNNLKAIVKNSYMMPFKNIEAICKNNYDEIEICGVATDVCVFNNIIGLYNYIAHNTMNTKIIVNSNCCASFSADNHNKAIKYFKETLNLKIK